jgi:hypothetical protein
MIKLARLSRGGWVRKTHTHAPDAASDRTRRAAQRDLAGYREKGYWTEFCSCGANRFCAVAEGPNGHVGIVSGPWSMTPPGER